jgi:hypothetical protein
MMCIFDDLYHRLCYFTCSISLHCMAKSIMGKHVELGAGNDTPQCVNICLLVVGPVVRVLLVISNTRYWLHLRLL